MRSDLMTSLRHQKTWRHHARLPLATTDDAKVLLQPENPAVRRKKKYLQMGEKRPKEEEAEEEALRFERR